MDTVFVSPGDGDSVSIFEGSARSWGVEERVSHLFSLSLSLNELTDELSEFIGEGVTGKVPLTKDPFPNLPIMRNPHCVGFGLLGGPIPHHAGLELISQRANLNYVA